MKIKEVKNKILEMYQTSLHCKFDDIAKHPIRVVESAKSIIGINPEKPVVKILDVCDNYLKNFKTKNISFDPKSMKMLEVVTYLELELSLQKRDTKKSFENIFYLSKVSDGKQILEFLIEFSLCHCNFSFLTIWSIYRMQMFMNFDKILDSLFVCAQLIIGDIGVSRERYKGSIEEYYSEYIIEQNTFDLFYNLYRIYNEDFTRKVKIRSYILSIIKEKCKILKNNEQNYIYKKDQENKGRHWILEYLDSADMDSINIEGILILDAARGTLKIIGNDSKSTKVWSDLNKAYEFK